MQLATPAKLRNGTWGARVIGAAREGEAIRIEARSGKTWTATVERVLWSGPDRRTGRTVSLCATESARGRSGARHRAAGVYCYHPCPVSGRKCCPENGPCHDCE